jgi:hypothetical protein
MCALLISSSCHGLAAATASSTLLAFLPAAVRVLLPLLLLLLLLLPLLLMQRASVSTLRGLARLRKHRSWWTTQAAGLAVSGEDARGEGGGAPVWSRGRGVSVWVVRAGVTQTGSCHLPDLNYAQMVDGCRLQCASSAVSTLRGLARLLRHRSWWITQAVGHVAVGNMGASAAVAWQAHG